MGKNGGPMTAKAISKKLKAKGLGRLRWYCQMCEKQCRDENGFQCHVRSDSHRRQLSIFADAPSEHLAGFSSRFLRDFLAATRQRFGTTPVQCNTAYQEYIKDRHHLHMNATRWTTLTDFVKDLGRDSHCAVELRDDGYWIRVVDKDAARRAAQARLSDKHRADERHRTELTLARQMKAAAKKIAPPDADGHARILPPTPLDAPVRLQPRIRPADAALAHNVFAQAADDDAEHDARAPRAPKRRSRWAAAPKKMSALEEIMRSQQSLSRAAAPRAAAAVAAAAAPPSRSATPAPAPAPARVASPSDADDERGWVMRGIEVRVMNASVGDGKYHKKKGRVTEVVQEYGAMVKLFEGGVLLQLDQDDLETVVPAIGGSVVLLHADLRGRRAEVVEWRKDAAVTVRLEGSGEVVAVLCRHVSRAA